ncbi:TonB-dependent receptor [Kordiimonas sp. SCSIO 12610]|uniref:TonB-dependent receptor n=1 Tax=Kordiimonas sp. SCSIO 12610 TaxID=2829597 RepID=UPI00210AEC7B|nr:TonB-dependent receptor [Kordiimonas sp. SCSIO 12610]UTW54639.1 TonB-dependent receptor [Kordiimonas sp. SCSIO 12610]
MKYRSIGLKASCSFMALSILGPALVAQDASDEKDEFVLEEIVVTSTKTGAVSLQEVPAAITAISSDALDQSGVIDLQGISYRTPGLTLGEFNVGQPQIFIRGIGSNDDGAGGDQSVGIFVDEVFIGRSAGASLDIFDLEQVEVLRGPQGTLFGKNVIGGAISFTTRKPTEEVEGKLEATYGNLDATRIRGYLSGPLSDSGTVLGKIAVNYFHRDGFVTDIDETLEFNDRNDVSVRGQLRLIPNEDWIIDLSADYARKRQNGIGRNGEGLLGTLNEDIFPTSADPFITVADEEGFQDRDIFGFSARAEYSTEKGTLTSITAYRDIEFSFLDDVIAQRPGSAGPNLDNGAIENSYQFTQELRWSGFIGDLDYVVGAFYLFEDVFRNEFFEIPGLDRGDSFQDNLTNSYAIFAQASYNINDRLTATVGARQTWETKENTQSVEAAPAVITNDIAEQTNDASFSAFTPRFVLDYQANDDLLLYGSIARGFKSGGFQGTPGNAQVAANSFDPEFAWNFEVGFKSTLLNDRLRFNVAAFLTDNTDLQVLQFISANDPNDPTAGFIATDNAATAEIKGIEVEFNFLATERLEIGGSYSYLDAEFTEFFDATGADFSGNPLRNAPDHKFNIGVTYTQPLSNGSNLVAYYEHRGQTRAFQDPAGDLRLASSIPGFDVANARLSYVPESERWKIDVWVDNLFDEVFQTHNFPLGNANGFSTPGAPRTYGVTATINF